MPRGRRPITEKALDIQIAQIDQEVENYKNKIAAAKEKRKKLVERKNKANMDALFEAVKASGKTADEFLKELQK